VQELIRFLITPDFSLGVQELIRFLITPDFNLRVQELIRFLITPDFSLGVQELNKTGALAQNNKNYVKGFGLKPVPIRDSNPALKRGVIHIIMLDVKCYYSFALPRTSVRWYRNSIKPGL